MAPKALVLEPASAGTSALKKRLQDLDVFSAVESSERPPESLKALRGATMIFQYLEKGALPALSWLARQQEEASGPPAPPVFILTRNNDRSGRILALELGAVESIDWSICDAELKARIGAQIRRTQNLVELHTTQAKLTHLTLTDPLTGLGNRAYLNRSLSYEIARSRREKRAFSLLMLDIDHFKRFNDTHGHQVGDLALRSVARCVRASIRSTDIACRFGGEEFSVILPGADALEAYRLAERILKNVQELSAGILRRFNPISVSIGIRSLGPRERFNASAIIADADTALYWAKGEGRNRSILHEADDRPHQLLPIAFDKDRASNAAL